MGRIYLRNCHTPREAWQPSIVRELIQLQADLELQKLYYIFVLRWKLFSIRLSFCIGWAAKISTLVRFFTDWPISFENHLALDCSVVSLKHFTSLLPNPFFIRPLVFPRQYPDFPTLRSLMGFARAIEVSRCSVGVGRDHAASWTCWNLDCDKRNGRSSFS